MKRLIGFVQSKKILLIMCVLSGLMLSGFSGSRKIVIYTIGDSTCANKPLENQNLERGWGQVLQRFFDSSYVRVDNRALNGRSSKSFRNEGHWKAVLDLLKPGDYVFIQFGHNDEKADTAKHTDPATTYKNQLRGYINETREKGGIPVLLTSIVRRKFDENGKLIDTHGDYIKAAREVASEMNVVLIDHNISSMKLVQKLGPEKSKDLFMWVEKGTNLAAPQGKKDDTHLKESGAMAMANLVVQELSKKIPELSQRVVKVK